jgi:hypothetical protein
MSSQEQGCQLAGLLGGAREELCSAAKAGGGAAAAAAEGGTAASKAADQAAGLAAAQLAEKHKARAVHILVALHGLAMGLQSPAH